MMDQPKYLSNVTIFTLLDIPLWVFGIGWGFPTLLFSFGETHPFRPFDLRCPGKCFGRLKTGLSYYLDLLG
jgi:hypothetical protein